MSFLTTKWILIHQIDDYFIVNFRIYFGLWFLNSRLMFPFGLPWQTSSTLTIYTSAGSSSFRFSSLIFPNKLSLYFYRDSSFLSFFNISVRGWACLPGWLWSFQVMVCCWWEAKWWIWYEIFIDVWYHAALLSCLDVAGLCLGVVSGVGRFYIFSSHNILKI